MSNIIIIGGGISGLASGILALKKGHNVSIYEKNDYLGGMFNLSYLNNYLLIGNTRSSKYRKVFDEFVNYDQIDIISPEYLYKYSNNESELFIYNNIDKFEKHLINIAMFDKDKIEEFCNLIRDVMELDFSYYKDENQRLSLFKEKNIRRLEKFYTKYGKVSIKEYFSKFNSEFLKVAFNNFIDSNNAICSFIMILALYMNGDLVYVNNPSLILDCLIDKYNKLGGKVYLKSRIDSIKYKDSKYELLCNDKTVVCDAIINSSDIHGFYYDLLKKKYLSVRNKYYFETLDYNRISSSVIITFECKKDLENSNYYSSYKLDKVFRVGAKDNDKFNIRVNDNKIIVSFYQDDTDYDFWKIISKNNGVYKKELDRIANDVKEMLENKYDNKLKIDKVLTPIDFEKEYGIYKGAINGYVLVPGTVGASFEEAKGLEQAYISSSIRRRETNYTSFYSCLLEANDLGKKLK